MTRDTSGTTSDEQTRPTEPTLRVRLWRLLFGTPVEQPEPTITLRLHPEQRTYTVGVLLTLLLGSLLALNEVNGLSRGFVAGGQPAMDFGALSGLPSQDVRDSWGLAMAEADLSAWNRLLRCFLVIDFVFIVVYTWLLRAIVKAGFVPQRWRGVVDFIAWLIPFADVSENLAMWFAGRQRVEAGPVGGYEPTMLPLCFSVIKWAALAAIVVSVALALILDDRDDRLRPWRSALWVQRYSLFAFLPVAALACLPVPKIGDQVPDIERRWLEGGAESWDLVWAVLATLIVIAPAVFFLGRLRADCAFKRSHDEGRDGRGWPWYYPRDEPREAHLWHWLIAPVLAVVLCGIAMANDWPVDPERLAAFCFITVFVPLASCVVRWRLQEQGGPTQHERARRFRGTSMRLEGASPDPAHVMAVGDALAIAAVAAVGLGMVRAWIGLLAVGYATTDVEVQWSLWLAIPLAVLAAVAPWLLAGRLLRFLDLRDEPAGAGTGTRFAVWATPSAPLYEGRVTAGSSARPRIVLLTSAGTLLVWMAFEPIFWASAVGVFASVTLALGAAMVLLGVIVAYAQESRPPEILLVLPRPWLSATPIVPFILIGLVVTARIGSPTFVHGIGQEGQQDRAVPSRPTLAEAFTEWTEGSTACTSSEAITVQVDGAEQRFDLRPMLILAAEGGGIRATYWTAQGLERVADAGGTCGTQMTFFSTGASGGSLGLSVGRYDHEPLEAVEAIRGPESLGAGAVALFTGDLIAATTGVRLGAPSSESGADGNDRAATMQQVWAQAWEESGSDGGPVRHRFVEAEDNSALTSVTGHLVLTSTDAYDGCRALWSQIDLSPPMASNPDAIPDTSNAPGCGNGGAGPNSYDVISAFGATQGTAPDDCLGNVSALTAGFVSGRFPYVTPSAVAGGCGQLTETPLVDGGIADNTGLGTIVDLAPQWGALVRAHNDEVLAAGAGALIVPMVVYLDNGSATNFGVKQRGTSIAESLIPLWAIGAAATRQSATSALLRESADAAERFLCSPPSVQDGSTDSTACEQLLIEQAAAAQVFVVHQATQPTLSAPLGWVLSNASVTDLESDMRQASTIGCAADPHDPVCLDGHGTLFDLRQRLHLEPRGKPSFVARP